MTLPFPGSPELIQQLGLLPRSAFEGVPADAARGDAGRGDAAMLRPYTDAGRGNRAISRPIPGRPTWAAGLRPRAGTLSSLLPARARGKNLLDLVRQIRDYNADASKAISNILRLANSGYTLEVLTAEGNPDPAGERILQQFLDTEIPRIAVEYGGGLDVLLDMIHLTVATQGAMAVEVELTEDTRDLADLIAVNPWLIDFERDPVTLRWVPGIKRLGSFAPLNDLQFKYVPLDPEPGDPRGRSPFWAALDIIFFQMEVLRDLKAAAHFTGYPRVDISVAWDAVYQNVEQTRPDLLDPSKADELRAWLDAYLGDIGTMVDDLEPDDAFIHYDSVKTQYVIPTGRTIDLTQLMTAIDNQIVAGLKQLPILLGRNEGATTTHATVQWQVFVQELKSFQRVSDQLVEWALTLGLRVRGSQSRVKMTWESLRTSDREAEARAEQMETQTRISWVQQGWVDNDEAALEMVGHEAVAEPAVADPAVGELGRQLGEGRSEGAKEGRSEGEEEGRAVREALVQLPAWQQARYLAMDDALWEEYRTQIRNTWERMSARGMGGGGSEEETKGRSAKEEMSGGLVFFKNGHGHRRPYLLLDDEEIGGS